MMAKSKIVVTERGRRPPWQRRRWGRVVIALGVLVIGAIAVVEVVLFVEYLIAKL